MGSPGSVVFTLVLMSVVVGLFMLGLKSTRRAPARPAIRAHTAMTFQNDFPQLDGDARCHTRGMHQTALGQVSG